MRKERKLYMCAEEPHWALPKVQGDDRYKLLDHYRTAYAEEDAEDMAGEYCFLREEGEGIMERKAELATFAFDYMKVEHEKFYRQRWK